MSDSTEWTLASDPPPPHHPIRCPYPSSGNIFVTFFFLYLLRVAWEDCASRFRHNPFWCLLLFVSPLSQSYVSSSRDKNAKSANALLGSILQLATQAQNENRPTEDWSLSDSHNFKTEKEIFPNKDSERTVEQELEWRKVERAKNTPPPMLAASQEGSTRKDWWKRLSKWRASNVL